MEEAVTSAIASPPPSLADIWKNLRSCRRLARMENPPPRTVTTTVSGWRRSYPTYCQWMKKGCMGGPKPIIKQESSVLAKTHKV